MISLDNSGRKPQSCAVYQKGVGGYVFPSRWWKCLYQVFPVFFFCYGDGTVSLQSAERMLPTSFTLSVNCAHWCFSGGGRNIIQFCGVFSSSDFALERADFDDVIAWLFIGTSCVLCHSKGLRSLLGRFLIKSWFAPRLVFQSWFINIACERKFHSIQMSQ